MFILMIVGALVLSYLTYILIAYSYSIGDRVLFNNLHYTKIGTIENIEVGVGPPLFSIGNIDFNIFPIWFYQLPMYVQNKPVGFNEYSELGKSCLQLFLGVLLFIFTQIFTSLSPLLVGLSMSISSIGIVGMILKFLVIKKVLPSPKNIVNKIILLLTNFHTICNYIAIFLTYLCIIIQSVTGGTYGI